MKPKNYSSEGIILAQKKYGEADRILVIFSKKYGKLSFIAKGVRKLKSKKRGSLEVFNHIVFSAAKGRNLDIITEVETKNSFERIRKNLKKASVSYFFVETVGRLTKDEEKNIELFNLLLNYLKKLTKTKKLKELRNKFTYDVLVLLGFWPKGKTLLDPDSKLEEITERKINSVRVGKKLF